MLKMTLPRHNLVTKFHKTPEICKHLARNLVIENGDFFCGTVFSGVGSAHDGGEGAAAVDA